MAKVEALSIFAEFSNPEILFKSEIHLIAYFDCWKHSVWWSKIGPWWANPPNGCGPALKEGNGWIRLGTDWRRRRPGAAATPPRPPCDPLTAVSFSFSSLFCCPSRHPLMHSWKALSSSEFPKNSGGPPNGGWMPTGVGWKPAGSGWIPNGGGWMPTGGACTSPFWIPCGNPFGSPCEGGFAKLIEAWRPSTFWLTPALGFLNYYFICWGEVIVVAVRYRVIISNFRPSRGLLKNAFVDDLELMEKKIFTYSKFFEKPLD